ncbi:MAG: fluoride efflux transporter CrcB [Pseudomonadales bacterium]
MATLIAIALGGAVGSLARYALSLQLDGLGGSGFPYGIMLANIAGSFLIGIAFVLLVEKSLLGEVWRSLLMVGFLGGFTTFSTFSIQALELLQSGRWLAAFTYIIGSLALSLIGAALGILLARQ